MSDLQGLLPESEKGEKLNYIKANTIVNKAISTYNGFPKMLKKDQMSASMVQQRDKALDQFIMLFDFTGTMSEAKELLYKKYQQPLLGEDK